MKKLSVEQMEKNVGINSIGCAIGDVITMTAFIDFGACTAGAGYVVLAIIGYGDSLYSLMKECREISSSKKWVV